MSSRPSTSPPLLRPIIAIIGATGTGKTAAFVIPIIQRLLNNKSKGLRCVVLVPTRELCEQIYLVFKEVGKKTPIKMMNLILQGLIIYPLNISTTKIQKCGWIQRI